jgi:hypothetical protein
MDEQHTQQHRDRERERKAVRRAAILRRTARIVARALAPTRERRRAEGHEAIVGVRALRRHATPTAKR